jgi:hypothetical protein
MEALTTGCFECEVLMYRKYEEEKAKLMKLCLPPEEYTRRLREIARRLGV